MAGLGDTLADLLARSRASAVRGPAEDLRQVESFGPNPGALRMWLSTSEALPPKSPLVVVLHGCGQTPAGYAGTAGWLALAEQYGFCLLCPEQTRTNNANLCFNWFEDADIRRGSGEAASIAQMVRHALATLDLDPHRIFITGLSAGGAMTAVMLAAYPELFTAGAIIAGVPYGAALGVGAAMAAMRRVPELSAKAWGDKVRAASPSPARWPRVAIWHGEADTTVTPAAGRALAQQWCEVHSASLSPTAEPTALTRHNHTTWRRPDGEVVVELHRIAGLGHGTPIAAGGVHGCGTPAPWILEAGLSSTREILRSWGIGEIARPNFTHEPAPAPVRSGANAGMAGAPAPASAVSGTISRALRKAGLLR